MLATLLPETGKAVRLAISGAPGAGKSSFIEAFGGVLTKAGHKVAVLAIDPSSQRTGGSILGDKTRMEHLSRDPNAFIRPSPSAGTLGGVARRTRDAMLLCEAAGYDVVLVETVGVGQSETAAADLTDAFVLLLPPGNGDDLQGIKKGIVELADIIVVTKADGDFLAAARRAEAEYRHALSFLRPAEAHWIVPVMSCSSYEGTGLDAVWTMIQTHRAEASSAGALQRRRANQAGAALWAEIIDSLTDHFRNSSTVRADLAALEPAVQAGTIPPGAAARQLLARFLER